MITYNGEDFPTRELDLGDYGEVTIALLHLNACLLDENGEITGDDEIAIDECIFYYCNSDEWKMDDQTLITYLKTIL